jgi:carboxyl-terminal processing protease
MIKEVFPDSPAAKAGLKSKDKIRQINHIQVDDMETNQLLAMIRNIDNSKIEIHLERSDELNNENELLLVEINKEIITVPSIHSKMIAPNIGYVQIQQFTENTRENFTTEFSKLEKQGIDSLIIDLRDNPGGLLQSAVELAELFVPENETILFIRSRIEADNFAIESSKSPKINIPKLAILINNATCSSAEILAGVLRLESGAVIIGEKSYGKGTIQNIFNINEDTALKITAAQYLLPDGSSIDEIGIEPDIKILNSEEAINISDLQTLISESINTEENENTTDKQLQKAIETLLPRNQT